MTLSDPKGGAGYAFGEKLPSGHVNTVWAQQPRALDSNGGTYSLTGDIILNGANALKLLHLELQAGGVSSIKHTLTVDSASGGSVLWSGTSLPALVSRSYTFTQPLIAHPTALVVLGNWVWEVVNNNWVQHVTSATDIWFGLSRLPHRATLTSVDVWVNGGTVAGHGGGLPANKIKATLYQKSPNQTGATTLGSTVQDNPASVGVYDAAHILSSTSGGAHTWSGLSTLISSNAAFYVRVEGETGANSVADTTAILGIEASFDCTSVAPG